jgi:phosphatidylglycerol:prolipoprotein diacylglycerol transferase
MLALAATAAYLLARRITRGHLNEDQLSTLTLWVIVFGFIGARLYHVLNEPAYYWAHPGQIIAVWNGGLAIHGGLIAGALTVWLWTRRNRISFPWLLDSIAPGIALGQAIGRWGNYFNQELFGRPTGLPWGIPIDPANRPDGFTNQTYFHPTFLYESLGDLLVLGLLLLLRVRWRARRDGDLVLVYLSATSLVRASTEFLRIDSVPIVLSVRFPLLVALAVALTALAILFYRHAKRPPIIGS